MAGEVRGHYNGLDFTTETGRSFDAVSDEKGRYEPYG